MSYPDHIYTQARALMFMGYSSDRVAAELRLAYGDDVPNASTLRAWRAESAEINAEEQHLIDENNRRLSLRFDGLIDRKLDSLENDIGKVRLPELVMGAGVYRDKDYRRRETEARTGEGAPQITFILVKDDHVPPWRQTQPPAIESPADATSRNA